MTSEVEIAEMNVQMKCAGEDPAGGIMGMIQQIINEIKNFDKGVAENQAALDSVTSTLSFRTGHLYGVCS